MPLVYLEDLVILEMRLDVAHGSQFKNEGVNGVGGVYEVTDVAYAIAALVSER